MMSEQSSTLKGECRICNGKIRISRKWNIRPGHQVKVWVEANTGKFCFRGCVNEDYTVTIPSIIREIASIDDGDMVEFKVSKVE